MVMGEAPGAVANIDLGGQTFEEKDNMYSGNDEVPLFISSWEESWRINVQVPDDTLQGVSSSDGALGKDSLVNKAMYLVGGGEKGRTKNEMMSIDHTWLVQVEMERGQQGYSVLGVGGTTNPGLPQEVEDCFYSTLEERDSGSSTCYGVARIKGQDQPFGSCKGLPLGLLAQMVVVEDVLCGDAVYS
ncbi:hypothetical protein BDN71DRAFT_1433978 [Pleurotus eryngii]|uniref:Uncharacterized protein n=1 Tax=Pleurotus eryngii TaxID=5323 RepID=A0A9P5ZPU2_PLEER|nr:hypothetical protein BDN71DRAFT_1433978 [Pleurotus eryngii]